VNSTESSGLALSLGLAATGLGLLLWQWAESRRRSHELSAEDVSHFARQDVRRWVVAGLMVMLSAGVYLGSRMPPRLNGNPNVRFLEVWLWVILLVLVLLVLALVDWLATRRYARRHRVALLREGLDILRSGRGHAAGPGPSPGEPRDRPKGAGPTE
jgi:hypothetical protein